MRKRLEHSLEIGPGGAPRKLGLVFASQRGSIGFSRLVQPGKEGGKASFLSKRCMEIRWEPEEAPAPGTRLTIELEYAGERPVVLDASLHESPTAELRREDPSEHIFAWRRTREKAPHKKHKRFFNQLDETLWPDDHPEHEELRQLLEDSQWKRRDGLDPYDGLVLSATLAATLRAVSEAFQAAFELYRSPTTGKLDLLSIEDAFDRFARAELSLLEPADATAAGPVALTEMGKACQPDSTFFFLFAELAGLCVHAGVHREVWEKLLPALVYVFRPFHDTYGVSNPADEAGGLLPPDAPVKQTELRARRAAFKQDLRAMTLPVVWENYLKEYLD